MKFPLISSENGVTLVGGGPVFTNDLRMAMGYAPYLIGVDSGADHIVAANLPVFAAIGDLDSISEATKSQIMPAHLHHISEQATTDFDKSLRSIDAPFALALGFSGGRSDHMLAVLNSLVRHSEKPCIVLGPDDITFAAPPGIKITLSLEVGDLVSLFPMAPVQGTSHGLEWPIAGLNFSPDGFVGTSNRASHSTVTLEFNQNGMLVILPRHLLAMTILALTQRQ